MSNGDIGGRADAAGERVDGRYLLQELLGRGGMASVWRAWDESLSRTVAVKIFRADVADATDLRRQRDEVTLLASLNHPGLVTLYDAVIGSAGAEPDRAYLVMEYVAGTDLTVRLARGPLPPDAVAALGASVAEALAYVHNRGVIHRDIKPGNILLPDAGDHHATRARLADFGIARLVDGARLTATQSIMGTAAYLSPEQAVAGDVGSPSDVYSLGLVLLECLTGERAFPGTTMEALGARLARDPDVPARLGERWRTLLRAMTQREPAARPDAAAVAVDLLSIEGATAVLPVAAVDEPTVASAAPVIAATARMPEPTATVRMPAPAATATVRMPAAVLPAPAARRRPWRWLLGVLVLVVGGGVALSVWASGIADAPASEAPSSTSPSATASATPTPVATTEPSTTPVPVVTEPTATPADPGTGNTGNEGPGNSGDAPGHTRDKPKKP